VAGLLCGAVVLSACGGLSSPAAVVEGRRISMDEVRSQIRPVERGDLEQLSSEGRKTAGRQVLLSLILLDLMRDYLDDHGIPVTSADVDAAFDQLVEGIGGEEAFEQVLEQQGITEAYARLVAEYNARGPKVIDTLIATGEAETLGVLQPGTAPSDLTDTERTAIFQAWVDDRFLHADIEVNPRFGHLDPTARAITTLASTAD
jgi:hypothetical protein